MEQKKGEGDCDCLPGWLADWSDKTQDGLCASCAITDTQETDWRGLTVVIPCRLERHRVHFCGILVHDDECAAAVDKEMAGYFGYDTYKSMPYLMEESARRSHHALCLYRHASQGMVYLCSHCKKEAPAKECSGCNRVFYCNADCQRQHWPEHKKSCLVGRPCPCLKGRDLVLWAKWLALQCAEEGCTRYMRYVTADGGVLVVPCMEPNARDPLHRIQTGYCEQHKKH